MRVREYLAWWLVILGWLVAGLEAQSAGHWKWLAAQRAYFLRSVRSDLPAGTGFRGIGLTIFASLAKEPRTAALRVAREFAHTIFCL